MEIFDFQLDFNRIPSRCGLEIHRGDGGAIVIVTELPDNPGMSICNAFEGLFLRVVEAYGLDPERVVWIERWGDWKTSEGAPYDRESEEWSQVRFRWSGTRARGARWVHVNETFVKAIVEATVS